MTLTQVDVITRGADRGGRENRGMSDDQVENERKAQEVIEAGVAQMRSALDTAFALSDVRAHAIYDAVAAFDNFVHDELPTEKFWNEAIAEARAK